MMRSVLVCADGATSKVATQLGRCTAVPLGVSSRAYIQGGTHNADFDGAPYMRCICCATCIAAFITASTALGMMGLIIAAHLQWQQHSTTPKVGIAIPNCACGFCCMASYGSPPHPAWRHRWRVPLSSPLSFTLPALLAAMLFPYVDLCWSCPLSTSPFLTPPPLPCPPLLPSTPDLLRLRWLEGAVFDFTAIYSAGEYAHKFYSGRRMWRALSLFAPALKLDPDFENILLKAPYPWAVVPEKKMGPRDLMAIHRDWYGNSSFDMAGKSLAKKRFVDSSILNMRATDTLRAYHFILHVFSST